MLLFFTSTSGWNGNYFSLQQFKNVRSHQGRLPPCFPTAPGVLSALAKLVLLSKSGSSDMVVECSSRLGDHVSFTEPWHHTSVSELALKAKIGPGMWSGSITSQIISSLPQASLKICPLCMEFQSRNSSLQHHWSQKET